MENTRALKVYVDCALDAGDGAACRRFQMTLLAFEQRLREAGIVVLNFGTDAKDLPFDPYTVENSIQSFVEIADAVVALHQTPSVGFSTVARETADRLEKPRFLFVSHEVNLCRAPTTTRSYFRCLYCSDEYPAKVLREHLRPKTISIFTAA